MRQNHKQFSSEQVKVLLKVYEAGHLSRDEIERMLGIGKTRYFALLKQSQEDPESFSILYEHQSPTRLLIGGGALAMMCIRVNYTGLTCVCQGIENPCRASPA